jgi:DNA-binding response OmpR family regulator
MAEDLHVLIIEDDFDLMFLIKKMLEIKGFKVLTAFTGKEARKKFRKNSTSLQSVILDLTLPDLDGKKICKEFRKKNPDVPIIITTGSEDPSQKQELDKLGITAYLKKPFDLNELINCIVSAN